MSKGGRPKAPLILTDDERQKLQTWASRPKSTQRLATRAKIVLACAEGLDNKDVAARLRVNTVTELLDYATMAVGSVAAFMNPEIIVLAGREKSGRRAPRPLGIDAGKGWVADDFDAPLPDDLLELFEGRS